MVWHNRSEDEDIVLQSMLKGKIVNKYPFTKEIYFKDSFWKLMNFPFKFKPNEFDFTPISFDIQDRKDLANFNDYQAKNPKATFIAKPPASLQGNGIFLFRELDEIPH